MTGTVMTWYLWGEELKRCIGDFSALKVKSPDWGGTGWENKKQKAGQIW